MSELRRSMRAPLVFGVLVLGALWWMLDLRSPPAPGEAGAPRETPSTPRSPAPPPSASGSRPDSAPAPTPAPEPGGPALVGRIIDHRGQPVAGATIDATAELVEDPPTCSGRSDADGRFRIVPPQPAVAWRLVVRANGCSPWQVETVFPDEERIIHVDPERRITGRVIDSNGEPVAGASVTWLGFLGNTPLARISRSGADGEFLIDGVPSPAALWNARESHFDDVSWLEAHGPWRTPTLVEVRPDEGRPEELQRDLVLHDGATIEGRVVDAETGAPIARASVVAWARGIGRHHHLPRPLGERTTGDDGSFLLPHLPETVVERPRSRESRMDDVMGWVRASAPGFAPQERTIPALPDRSRQVIELRLPRAGSVTAPVEEALDRPPGDWLIHVVVRDPEGRPVPGAYVRPDDWIKPTSIRASSFPTKAVRTNDRGFAVIRPVSWPAQLLVRAPGRAPAITPPVAPGAPVVETRVTLFPGLRIAGRIRESDGRPAAGIVVTGAPARPRAELLGYCGSRRWTIDDEGIARSTCSGADGSFEIVGLPEGLCRIGAQDPGENRSPSELRRVVLPDVPAGKLDVVVELPALPAGTAPTTIEGTVLDAETRQPIPRFEVRLFLRGRTLVARPSEPGRFRFEAMLVPPGAEIGLIASAEGYLDDSIGTEGPHPPASLPPLWFSLRRAATVRGRVKGPDGLDLAGATIRFEELLHESPTARIGPDGRYVLKGLDPAARPVGRELLGSPAVAGASDEVVLHPIVEFEKVPLEERALAVRPRAGLRLPLREREVRLDLSVVRAGILRLETSKEGNWVGAWHLEVRDASSTLLRELDFAREGSFFRVPGGFGSGRYPLLRQAFPPGVCSVRLEGPTSPPAQWNVTVTTGQETTLTLAPP